MATVVGFDPAKSGQKPTDDQGNHSPVGVWGDSSTGVGVFGTSGKIPPNEKNIPILKIAGVEGHSFQSPGVLGKSIENVGVEGFSDKLIGVHGQTGEVASNPGVAGVWGEAHGSAG